MLVTLTAVVRRKKEGREREEEKRTHTRNINSSDLRSVLSPLLIKALQHSAF